MTVFVKSVACYSVDDSGVASAGDAPVIVQLSADAATYGAYVKIRASRLVDNPRVEFASDDDGPHDFTTGDHTVIGRLVLSAGHVGLDAAVAYGTSHSNTATSNVHVA